MNDEYDDNRDEVTPDPDLDPDLDPAQDARIRALLAELGSGPDGEPIPPEVEARLDDTLAMLVAERGRTDEEIPDEGGSDNVVPLRRRWIQRATVAAAAVIVLGIGSVAVSNLGLMSGGDNSTADSAGESEQSSASEAPDSSSDSDSSSDTGAATLPELSAASFASDVETLLKGRASMLTPEGEAAGDQPKQENRDSAKPGAPNELTSRACPGPEITDGAVPNQVRYDGRLAVLLVHPESGGQQVVEAWNCAGNRKLASTTITP